MTGLCPLCTEPCKEIEKLTGENAPKFIECPRWEKLYMFLAVPAGFRKADKYDVMVSAEQPRIGVNLILHSFQSPIYQSYRITDNTDLTWLMEFVRAGKCFVR